MKLDIMSYSGWTLEELQEMAKTDKAVEDTKTAYYNAKADVDKYSQAITPDYGDIDKQIAELEAEVKKCSDYIQEAYKINDSIGQSGKGRPVSGKLADTDIGCRQLCGRSHCRCEL